MRMKCLSGAVAAVLALAALSHSALAGQVFDDRSFAQAQESGKSILVDVKAPWCPTCAAQQPIIDGIERGEPRLVVFDVDFDTAKDVLRRFNVGMQSTLIVFKGKSEVGRSTGQTDPAVIRALIAKGL